MFKVTAKMQSISTDLERSFEVSFHAIYSSSLASLASAQKHFIETTLEVQTRFERLRKHKIESEYI